MELPSLLLREDWKVHLNVVVKIENDTSTSLFIITLLVIAEDRNLSDIH